MNDAVMRTPTRRVLATVVVAAAAALVVATNRSDMSAAVAAAHGADARWAVLLGASSFVLLAALVARHRAAQRAVGIELPLAGVARAAMAAHFLNSVSKSGGVAGVAPFAIEARRAGRAP